MAGTEGIIKAYTSAIAQVKLWGPTNVAPIIHLVATLARNAHNYPDKQVLSVTFLKFDITYMIEPISRLFHTLCIPWFL